MDWNKGKSRGARRALLAIMFLVLSATVGCGMRTNSEKTAEDRFCENISVFACRSGRSFCDKGMVQIEDGLMIFHEYGTGKSYPLCSDAYCEHIPYSDSKNPDPVCEATMKDLKEACIHGDYV